MNRFDTTCRMCGKPLHDVPKNTKYCSDCLKIRVKKSHHRTLRPEEAVRFSPPLKSDLDIARVDALARQEGISYGKYVLKYGIGRHT